MEAWTEAWRALRRLFWGAVALAAILLLAEGSRLVAWAWGVHPVVGWAVAGALLAAVWFLLVSPLVRLLGWRPAAARPDAEASLEEWRGYGERIRRHPALSGTDEARKAARVLPMAADAGEARDAVSPLCAKLDAAGRKAVERAAVKSFTLTAVSQRAAWDALAVLAVQAGMLSDIAGVYRERPALSDLAGLGRRVVVASGIAGGLDALGDHAAQAILRSWTSVMKVVTASVAQGLLNAFITLRLGEVARQAAAGQPVNAAAASWWALGRLSLLPLEGAAGAAWQAATRGLGALREKVGYRQPERPEPSGSPLAPVET